jgi:lipopolysaccharide transport system ATP-binding protein
LLTLSNLHLMETPIIKISNISKRYQIGAKRDKYLTMRDTLVKIFRNPLSLWEKKDDFWALKGINLDIARGEAVGIIGANGAGKSTLLKLLSRITPPTEGEITIQGRVSSLLEVGTGFNSELSGRENIYLNGAILGMSKKEIEAKMESIIEFAGVEKFIDTPIKYYSSGMSVRLAFSVAAHLEPDILIVDEVLAVGDADFQKKCLGKMDEVVKKSGRTILFVSHNMEAVQSLCSRAVFLKNGQIAAIGTPQEMVEKYLGESKNSLSREWSKQDAPRNCRIAIKSCRLEGEDKQPVFAIGTATSFMITAEYENFTEDAMLNFQVHLYTEDNTWAFVTASEIKKYGPGPVKVACHIPGNLLNNRIYKASIQVRSNNSALLHVPDALIFDVQESESGNLAKKFLGAVRPKLKWDLS